MHPHQRNPQTALATLCGLVRRSKVYPTTCEQVKADDGIFGAICLPQTDPGMLIIIFTHVVENQNIYQYTTAEQVLKQY